jgi:CheY-like chemotaxis protein
MAKPIVLLVDDVPELAVIVAALGKRGEYEVVARPDVPAAWAYLEGNQPDLVLLDVHLPGEDGLELCRRVRATPALADLPIALFSHWGRPEDIVAALEAGVDYLVSKDLVGQPAQWRRRLGEILPPAHGQRRKHSLGWRAEAVSSQAPSHWVAALHQALARPCWRKVEGELLRRVLRQALNRASPGVDADAWLSAEGASLSSERLPPRDVAIALVASLAEQMWCLLGTEASRPFWEALASVVPGNPELWECPTAKLPWPH